METKCVKLEDGLEYAVIDEIDHEDNTYVYLVNYEDETDFCIRKVENSVNEKLLQGLDSNEEFDKALLLFTVKHKDDDLGINN